MRSLLVFSMLVCAGAAQAQTTNIWIKPASGDWQDAFAWSLEREPIPGDMVIITNQGWKAVAIGPATESRDIAGVILGGYTDSFNVLLLNYAGFGVPVTANTVTVGSNSAITALSSVLTVSSNSGPGDLSIFSSFNQGANATVNAHVINLGDVTNAPAGSGTYNQTNGIVNADAISAWNGSTFNQFDGANAIVGSLSLGGRDGANVAHYTIASGWLTVGTIQLERGDFHQNGGSVTVTDSSYRGSLSIAAATYTLSAGTLQLPGITIPNAQYGPQNPFPNGISADATLLQTGGTNFCNGDLTEYHEYGFAGVPLPIFGPGRYVLSNGVLCVTSVVNAWMGEFQQWGGAHTNAGTEVSGDTFPNFVIHTGSFTLGGGTLITPSVSIGLGDFTQSGGTNQVSGDVAVGASESPSTFTLSGGLLTDLNTTVAGSNPATPAPQTALFTQSGGTHIVTNLLRLSGPPPYVSQNQSLSGAYVLSNGVLNAPNIQLDTSAHFYHYGGTLTTSGLLNLAYATWNENTSGQQFGQLVLSAPAGSNATFSLPSGNCLVRFAASSSVVWSNQAGLFIDNWNGSINGGGSDQVYFGSNASGLTAQQLSQIRFRNPAGFSGLYSAVILATGEIIPNPAPPPAPSGLQLVGIYSNRLDLIWNDNSTNEASFKLERSLNGVAFTQITNLPANTTSYSDTGLSPVTTYYYRVRSSGFGGDSPYSSVASATTLNAPPPPTCTPVATPLAGWWKGENSTADVTGLANGVWAGYGNTNTYAPGMVGQAFAFDGFHRDRVDLGNPTNLQLQVFTIEAWIKRSSAAQVSFDDDNEDGSVAGQGGLIVSYGREGYGLGLLNNGQVLLSKIDVDSALTSSAVTDTGWHHIAVTKSSSNAIFYVDGQVKDQPIPYTSSYTFTTSISIGSRGDARGGTFFGLIDEPAVYGRVLSAAEIYAIYYAGAGGKCPPPSLPPGWARQDIGSVGIPGSSSFSNGAFQVVGSGNDIWDFHDQFQFAYRIWNGNGEIVARVTRLDNTDPWAKAGVMFRDSLADNSDNAFATFTSQHGAAFQWRTNSSFTTNTPAPGSVPGWVKLVRVGNLFTAFVSGDGQSWTQIGAHTVPMTNQALVGVAVTSHNNSTLCEGDFYVRIDVPGAPPPAPVISSLARQSNGNIQLVIQGEVGRNYEVQASGDLFHWVSLGTQFDTNGSITIVDASASGLSHRFYRARVVP